MSDKGNRDISVKTRSKDLEIFNKGKSLKRVMVNLQKIEENCEDLYGNCPQNILLASYDFVFHFKENETETYR